MLDGGIPAMVMRGGTSKGLYLQPEDLPPAVEDRDDLLLRLVGSPDARQIDGIGGGHPLTSKVAIVGRSPDDQADIDYLFLQIGVDQPLVSDRQNCGNLLAGVGPFAVERGLVEVGGELAEVRIRMLNTGGTVVARFPLHDRRPRYVGDTRISGVPGRAARIDLEFDDVAGGTCGALLPTGNTRDVFEELEVTCVDNGMPVVVLRASDLGVRGDETCDELEANTALRERIEAVRIAAGPAMALGDVRTTTIPKMTLIAPSDAVDKVVTRTFIPHRCHSSIGVLGAVSVATACLLPGSVADTIIGFSADPEEITLAHPTGTFTATVRLERDPDGAPAVRRAGIVRTARKLMDGQVFPRPAS